jgi:hypothetical protein
MQNRGPVSLGNTGGSFGASGYSLPVAEEVRGFRKRCSELTSLIRRPRIVDTVARLVR